MIRYRWERTKGGELTMQTHSTWRMGAQDMWCAVHIEEVILSVSMKENVRVV
jgi:hypothetical protein